MAKYQKIKSKCKNLSDFTSKLDDLCKINDTIKLKIDSKDILIYSVMNVANDNPGSDVLAFKNYTLNTSDYFDGLDSIEFTIDFVITDAKKFSKKLSFFETTESHVIFQYIDNKENDLVKTCNCLDISNKDLNITTYSGEPTEIRDMPKDRLSKMLDTNNSEWNFKMSSDKFSDIKRLCNIDTESKIVCIKKEKTSVVAQELGKWKMTIDSTDDNDDREINFNKKFLSNVNDNNNVEFFIFERFMLNKSENGNLMISFEQSYS
jgi:hypothetical protein